MSDHIIHPFLTNREEEDLQSGVLWNTNAEFPLSKLVVADNAELKPEDVRRQESVPEVVAIDKNVERDDVIEMEGLSPYAQWLLALKPISVEGSSGYTPASGKPILPEIQSLPAEAQSEKPDKKKKKKKKHKKKKKEARRKAEKPETIPPVLGTDIASDTLAELIASQGHIEEAIVMYRKLVNLYPDKAAHYLQKITDLRQLKP